MEFDLISRYFDKPFRGLLDMVPEVIGIGDDCASWLTPENQRIFVSTDTSVQGVHFFPDEDPHAVGWKSLAVNVSDLAASGAKPSGFTLCLTLPDVNHDWLRGFSAGLLKAARHFDCPLLGGDTTSSMHTAPLVISIQVFGFSLANHRGFPRSSATLGQDIWVTGRPGIARLGLLLLADQRGVLGTFLGPNDSDNCKHILSQLSPSFKTSAIQALRYPVPRVQFAQMLRGLAGAMIDLSDGLAGDLMHVLKASKVGAVVEQPLLASLWQESLPSEQPWFVQQTLIGGDDYELCFTADPANRQAIETFASQGRVPCHRVGKITEGNTLSLLSGNETSTINLRSHQHFR